MKLFNQDDLRRVSQGTNKGKILESQKVLLRCDICQKLFHRLYCKVLGNSDLCKSCSITKHNQNRSPESKSRMLQASIKACTGKTLEHWCGTEKAKKIKNEMSERNSGQNNPNFGAKYSRGFADHPITGTFEDNYGTEKANNLKRKQSERNSGKNNPMHGKPSPCGSGNGWSGWFKGKFFRSLLELSFMIKFENEGIQYSTGEKIKYKIPYYDNGKLRNYFPDFIFEDGRVIEIKPKALISSFLNSLKFAAARERFGEKFIVLTEENCVKIDITNLLLLIETETVILMDKYKEKLEKCLV